MVPVFVAGASIIDGGTGMNCRPRGAAWPTAWGAEAGVWAAAGVFSEAGRRMPKGRRAAGNGNLPDMPPLCGVRPWGAKGGLLGLKGGLLGLNLRHVEGVGPRVTWGRNAAASAGQTRGNRERVGLV